MPQSLCCRDKKRFDCCRVPPVLNSGACHNISKADHVVNLTPTMLTNPTTATRIVVIKNGASDVLAIGCGWSLIVKDISTTSTMTTLIIMIVYENQGSIRVEESPLWTPIDEPTQLVLATKYFTN
ncbi:unnamed protein product [Ceratitis capitata]|uniref:(Mediterranean fruit fly) hypothetical protein n=1 Tax=Ceratitis capitata TaxID=7213 RepID=A0A811V8L4_CERCA|nr:unnamed protein product [Ceratitis capitata]